MAGNRVLLIQPLELLAGYANGIFPMAHSAGDPSLSWYDPPRRGILPLDGVHASRTLIRDLGRGGWTATLDDDFDAIVRQCGERAETWINAPLRKLYAQLHQTGHAHALAVYKNGALAGGLFGVSLGGAFFGESMFSTQTSGSRMALVWLANHLERCGFMLLDTQYLTPHLASMGGIEITRLDYRTRLARALRTPADFRAWPLSAAQALAQSLRMKRAATD